MHTKYIGEKTEIDNPGLVEACFSCERKDVNL